MTSTAEQFRFTPDTTSHYARGHYHLIDNPNVVITDLTPIDGGYCPGVHQKDGTFAAFITCDTLDAAMDKALAAANECHKKTPKPAKKKQPPVTIIKIVLFFSPAGAKPKASAEISVPGKPKISKRSSSTIHFDVGDRSFIADKASWMARKDNGFIYAIEAGTSGSQS